MPGVPSRRALVSLAKIIVSGALLALLFSRVEIATLWTHARNASPGWLGASLGACLLMLVLSAWRWDVLLEAAGVALPFGRLIVSFLVATFFNNFLPSNIGGDVVRIADTARPAGSKTIAALIVLTDRGVGLLGLLTVAALGASLAEHLPGTGVIGPSILWMLAAGGLAALAVLLWRPGTLLLLLRPIQRLHPEWVGEQLDKLEGLLGRLRRSPGAIGLCLSGAIVVQLLLVSFYFAIAISLGVPISFWQLALIVPMTFIAQMLPVSMNGFGVREATFAYYFTRLGLRIEQALLVSFVGAAMMLVFSLSGAAAYLARGRRPVDTEA